MGNRADVSCRGDVCPKAGERCVSSIAGEKEVIGNGCADTPAGAVFQQTVKSLNELDRLLLTFASTANLAFVRWLCRLGADVHACDSNGTTCLHAACRSGSLAVVGEFIYLQVSVDAKDSAGWTALHVACFIGRRSAAVQLMQSDASLEIKNTQGQAPADLSSDVWLRDVFGVCIAHRRDSGNRPWHCPRHMDTDEDSPTASPLRFEPFFVPRAPVLHYTFDASLVQLAVDIFNQRPGQGLAFLVATGCVQDFPVELSKFLGSQSVNATKAGEFLGEDFSLSNTLRLEYINSIAMTGTGVVSCLAKVFKHIRVPSELDKLDRLVSAVAQIWWRQHEQVRKTVDASHIQRWEQRVESSREVAGFRLMRHMSGSEVLHQIMLSTVFLHWNLYAPLPPSKRLDVFEWLNMTRGLADSPQMLLVADEETNIQNILYLIYDVVSHSFFPQLQIWLKPHSCETPSGGESAPVSLTAASLCGLGASGVVEGWGLVLHSDFPIAGCASRTVAYRKARSILSEMSPREYSLTSPATSRNSRLVPETVNANEGGKSSGDWVWLSIRESLLFLAPKSLEWAPYAFLHLEPVVVQAVDKAQRSISLAARGSLHDSSSGSPGRGADQSFMNVNLNVVNAIQGGDYESPQMQLVFLLPDGRWQVLCVPYLQIQFPDLAQLETWREALLSSCGKCASESLPRNADGYDGWRENTELPSVDL